MLVFQDVAFDGEEAKYPKRGVEAVQQFARGGPPQRQRDRPRIPHAPDRSSPSVRPQVRGVEAKIAELFPAEAAEFDDVAETGVGI